MKTLVIYFMTIFLYSSVVVAQPNPEWEVYSKCTFISSITFQDNYSWVGTDVGLVMINVRTGERTYYNKSLDWYYS